jgi:hypothetical protein
MTESGFGDEGDRQWRNNGFFDAAQRVLGRVIVEGYAAVVFSYSDERLTALSAAGDPLERISHVIHFEVFRGVLVLQTLYTLSDDQTPYQLKDRLSFIRLWGWHCTTQCPPPRRSGSIASG